MAGVGLWERRKVAAMREIQDVALELFESDGYTAVTVERVASVAGVSSSSVYRYFGSKEMLILHSELYPRLLDVIRGLGGGATISGASLARMLRSAIPVMLDLVSAADSEPAIRLRLKFAAAEPDVKAGMTRQTEEMATAIADVLAERTGGDIAAMDLAVAAASATWGFHAALEHWAGTADGTPLRDVLEQALALIATGIEAQFGDPGQPKTTSQTAM